MMSVLGIACFVVGILLVRKAQKMDGESSLRMIVGACGILWMFKGLAVLRFLLRG